MNDRARVTDIAGRSPVPVRPSERVLTLAQAPSGEAELLAGVIQRKPQSLAELFDRYAPLVRRLLMRLLGDDADIDDLSQEVFLVVVRRARDIEDPSALRSFIVGTVMRTGKNELRKRRVRRFIGLDEAPGLPTVRGHDSVRHDQVRRVYAAFDKMDPRSRTLFVLRHVEGFELKELAEASGCSLATIKRKLSRANERFRAIADGDPSLRELLRRAEA